MSSKRLNKRQLREQQELEELAELPSLDTVPGGSKRSHRLQEPQKDHEEEGADEEQEEDASGEEVTTAPASVKPTTTSLFAMLGGEEAEEEDEQEEDEDVSAKEPVKSKKKKSKKKKKKQAAAAAAQGGDGDEGEGGEAEGRSVANTPAKSSTQASKKGAFGGSKSKASAAAGAGAGAKDVSEMSMEELDKFLASQAELNAASATSKTGSSSSRTGALTGSSSSVSSFRTHLSLDPRSLDPGIELRRQFGSAAIKAYQNEAGAAGSSASSGARARAQATNPNLKVRSILCTPKDYWPPIARSFTGMSMDVLDSPSHGGRICSWKHSKVYRQVQMQFLEAVKSYDPNSLMALLRVYPYHIDTLLQLSEYSRHQGDLGQAGDFNDRALFAFERCANPYFVSCLSSSTSGPPMINFNKIENRAFYLALHRQIGFLGRRGTWRTALEWSKLLLGLGQDGEDHHASLLWIDFLAIKAKQHRWLLELIPKLDEQRARRSSPSFSGGVSRIEDLSVGAVTPIDSEVKEVAGESEHLHKGTLDWCVGLAYARALALRAVEKEESNKGGVRSRAALRLAIARYPSVVPLLCNKIGVDLPSKIAGHPLFQVENRWSDSNNDDGGSSSLSCLLTHIYVLRSESLWKEPGLGQWLRTTAIELADTLIEDHEKGRKECISKHAVASQTTKLGVYRHVLVSDLPDTMRQQLIAYLPPSITSSSEQMDAFDPVPPRTLTTAASISAAGEEEEQESEKVTRYNDEYFQPVLVELDQRAGRGGRGGSATGQDRDGGGEGMMQALMRALQGLDGGGGEGGGMQGWDTAMQNMDDETREDVMAQMMQLAAEARRHRGGGTGDDEDEMPDAFVGGRDDGDGAGAVGGGGGPFAALRGVLDAIWGGATGGGGNRDPALHEDLDDEYEDEEQEEEEQH